MGNTSEFVKIYEKEMGKIQLPQELADYIEIEKCLKSGEDTQTFLVKEKILNRTCVMKWGRGNFGKFLEQEYRVLHDLKEKNISGIPCPYRLLSKQDGVYFLREYIPGQSLDEIVEDGDELTEREIRKLGTVLCRMTEQLQNMEPPLIHRDIKPENIVFHRDGELFLIDFGTARYYQKGSGEDTFLVGSRRTAAPEQYGCQQTDLRTDVYAIGKTLWYAAAGNYDRTMLEEARISRRLRKIILKASAFDPEKRYRSAAELEKILDEKRGKRAKMAAGIVLFAAVFLGAGVLIGGRSGGVDKQLAEQTIGKEQTAESSKITPAPADSASAKRGIVFHEKIIEQAVRQQLNLTDSAPITQEMLLDITSIRIVGNQILTDTDNYREDGGGAVNGQPLRPEVRGTITDLADLSYMKHLLTVIICNQRIADISPLENLPIEKLYLMNNNIQDISAVESLYNLNSLGIGGNPLKNPEILSGCSGLRMLDISESSFKNLDFMKNLQLENLSIMNTKVEEGWDVLTELPNLLKITIDRLDEEMMQVFYRIKNLDTINCWGEYCLTDLTPLAGIENLAAFAASVGLKSLEGAGNLPKLEYLFINYSEVHDLSPILSAKSLKMINISNMSVFDLSPIVQHPALESVICNERQKERILELDPSPKFEMEIC